MVNQAVDTMYVFQSHQAIPLLKPGYYHVGQPLHVNKITPFSWQLNTQIRTVLMYKNVCHCMPNEYVKN